jgi:hypothetical protein
MRKRLFLSRVHQHSRLGDTRATNDVVSVAHYSQPGRAWGNETIIPIAHKEHLTLLFTLVFIQV